MPHPVCWSVSWRDNRIWTPVHPTFPEGAGPVPPGPGCDSPWTSARATGHVSIYSSSLAINGGGPSSATDLGSAFLRAGVGEPGTASPFATVPSSR